MSCCLAAVGCQQRMWPGSTRPGHVHVSDCVQKGGAAASRAPPQAIPVWLRRGKENRARPAGKAARSAYRASASMFVLTCAAGARFLSLAANRREESLLGLSLAVSLIEMPVSVPYWWRIVVRDRWSIFFVQPPAGLPQAGGCTLQLRAFSLQSPWRQPRVRTG